MSALPSVRALATALALSIVAGVAVGAVVVGLGMRPAGPGGAGASADDGFPADWFWSEGSVRRAHLALAGRPAPPLELDAWRGTPVELASLRGKVVVVDFWATWCGPCMSAIPKNIALVNRYAGQGMVFVGVHDHRSGVDRIDAAIRSRKINYPVAVDRDGRSAKAYAVGFWPTYAVIDRRGILRAVGLRPDRVEDVVVKLLSESSAEPTTAGAETTDAGQGSVAGRADRGGAA